LADCLKLHTKVIFRQEHGVITAILLKMRVFCDVGSCQGNESRMFRRMILTPSSGSDGQNVGKYLPPKKTGLTPQDAPIFTKINPYLKGPQNSLHVVSNYSPLSLSIQHPPPPPLHNFPSKINLNFILPLMPTPPNTAVFVYACPTKLFHAVHFHPFRQTLCHLSSNIHTITGAAHESCISWFYITRTSALRVPLFLVGNAALFTHLNPTWKTTPSQLSSTAYWHYYHPTCVNWRHTKYLHILLT
jgi:hypothetical protein